ncbi:MAG: tRNA (guanosine(37)-N1)-methyltransferase TrmD [Tenericutes bacterium]|nr:tRNA (guanosine(37)-N1)-methyltransferase TrmD [Mycoplasmatota bacterium]
MKITILSLFPEMITPILSASILKRAVENNSVEFNIVNFRDFSQNKHQTVDDTPYGGGAGMVLAVEPIFYALESIEGYKDAHKILLSPQGKTYQQEKAKSLLNHEHIILICGHYEGFDDRIRSLVDEEISIGDYVMTGGEIAAMAIVDSVVRMLPEVLGDEESYINDSFYDGLLDYPQYTKPREFKGMKVPDVLLSGHHKNIEEWRLKEKIERTKIRRPDLYDKYIKDNNNQ